MPSLYEPPTEDETLLGVATDPDFYDLGHEISLIGHGRGREDARFGWDLGCLLMDIGGRVYGSRSKCCRVHRKNPDLYNRLRHAVTRMTGADLLPDRPPSEDQVRQWRQQWVPSTHFRDHGPDPHPNLGTVQHRARQLAFARARLLGNLPDNNPRDFANPDPRNIVSADGTWLSPFSSARTWTDERSGTTYVFNTKAKTAETARIPDVVRKITKHGNSYMGICHVTLLTRTPYGRVILGVDRALGWETLGTLGLLEDFIGIAGETVHMLCHDMGFRDWPIDWLMAEHGVPVISTAIPEHEIPAEETEARLDIRKVLRESGLPGLKNVGRDSDPVSALVQERLNARGDLEAFAAATRQGVPTGLGLPLGTSQYLSSRGNLTRVDSAAHEYGEVSHPGPDGEPCGHLLYVDDGALWEVRVSGGAHIKAQRAISERSTRTKHPDTGDWAMVTTHRLLCEDARQPFEFDTIWEPVPHRGKRTEHTKKPRTSLEKALHAMQPLARCDRGFGDIYGLRNDTESWFSWLKARMRRGETAASLHADHQLLDVLYAGLITNALALRQYRLSNPEASQDSRLAPTAPGAGPATAPGTIRAAIVELFAR
ncbi:hypothetical protein GCM10009844_22610 [Nocardioides koreensis]|uniref:Transposase n=1 Tax=Nocardioides koreensis TaxID=433651 RepID=A0ABP5LK09_9ACTN